MRATSIAELTAAVAGAMPGDCVVLANGDYTVTAPIVVDRVGTANQRITVMAETINFAGTGHYNFAPTPIGPR